MQRFTSGKTPSRSLAKTCFKQRKQINSLVQASSGSSRLSPSSNDSNPHGECPTLLEPMHIARVTISGISAIALPCRTSYIAIIIIIIIQTPLGVISNYSIYVE